MVTDLRSLPFSRVLSKSNDWFLIDLMIWCNSVELCHPRFLVQWTFVLSIWTRAWSHSETMRRWVSCIPCCSIHSASLLQQWMCAETSALNSVEMLFARLCCHVDEVIQSDYIRFFSFLFCAMQVEVTVRVSPHTFITFWLAQIIDELPNWNFQDAKFRQILKFDSVVVQGGGGKYMHTTKCVVGVRLMQVLASSVLSSIYEFKATPNARPCIPVFYMI